MQDFRRETRRGGDTLDGPPDASRPSNPWPRLIAFAAVLVAGALLGAICFAAFVQAPPREIRVRGETVEPGVPRFFPVTAFGADADGTTFGAYLSVMRDGTAVALLSRSPETGCHVRFNATAEAGGVFLDRCGAARYAPDGHALTEDAASDLHAFPLRVERDDFVITIERVRLGECRTAEARGCSPPGEPRERRLGTMGLPARFD